MDRVRNLVQDSRVFVVLAQVRPGRGAYVHLLREEVADHGCKLDTLGSDRHRAYRIIGLEAHLAPGGSFEVSADGMGFSRLGISSA